MQKSTGSHSSTKKRVFRQDDSSSGQSTSSTILNRVCVRKTDIIPVAICILFVAICVFSSLLGYFLLKTKDRPAAMTALDRVRNDSTKAYSVALQGVLQAVTAAAAFYNRSTDPDDIGLMTDFYPFMYSSGRFPLYLQAVCYNKLIHKGQMSALVATMRERGGEYSNFTVTARDANNQPIPVPDTMDRVVAIQCLPLYTNKATIGYDVISNPAKNDTYNRALENGAFSITPAVTLGNIRTKAVASAIIFPIYNSTLPYRDVIGMVNGAIVFNELLSAALAGIAIDVYVALYDMNNTKDGFMFSTQIDPATGVFVDSSQNDQTIASAQFTLDGYVPFGDRIHKLTFIPSDSFLAEYDLMEKWIPVIVSMIFMLIIIGLCSLLALFLRMQTEAKNRQKRKEFVAGIIENQKKLQQQMNDMNLKEQLARSVMNAMADFVLAISGSGLVLDTNSSFDKVFEYGPNDFSTHSVRFGSLFPDLDSDFLKNVTGEVSIGTRARTKKFEYIPVNLSVKNIKAIELSPSPIVDNDEEEEDIRYVVIAMKM